MRNDSTLNWQWKVGRLSDHVIWSSLVISAFIFGVTHAVTLDIADESFRRHFDSRVAALYSQRPVTGIRLLETRP